MLSGSALVHPRALTGRTGLPFLPGHVTGAVQQVWLGLQELTTAIWKRQLPAWGMGDGNVPTWLLALRMIAVQRFTVPAWTTYGAVSGLVVNGSIPSWPWNTSSTEVTALMSFTCTVAPCRSGIQQ